MSVEAYRAVLQAFVRGDFSPEEFARRLNALPPAPAAYDYANRFKAMMDAGRSHANGFVYWLSAALPQLKTILESEYDELDVGERLYEFWDDDGYFRPSSSPLYQLGEVADLAPKYVARIVDPDNALSWLVSVRRYTPGCDVSPAEAPQGGASHIVLLPSDFSWLLHEEHAGDEAPVLNIWVQVRGPAGK